MLRVQALGSCLLTAATLVGCAAPSSRLAEGRGQPDSRAEQNTGREQLPSPAHNVVLVSVDTLRADHLGCAGYGPPTSPAIDAFRNEAVFFASAFAQAPSTLPSHASMLSSLLPSHHTASFSRSQRLPESVVTVTELLAEAGWRTAAFVGGGQMAEEYGLGQGFEIYRNHPPDRAFAEVVEEGLGWIDGIGDGRFFLFLHTYEVHHPYTPEASLLEIFDAGYTGALPPRISKELLRRINAVPLATGEEPLAIDARDLAHIVAAYDAEIRSVDEAFADLIAGLDARAVLDDTLVIFTADHGEEFGEHGVVGWHSHTLYDELLAVPLIVRFPGASHGGRRVEQLVRSLDIAPTILEASGLGIPSEFSGRSLLSLLRDPSRWPIEAVVSQQDTDHGIEHSCIRGPRFKLYPNDLYCQEAAYRSRYLPVRAAARFDIWWRPHILFDLAADPGEHHPRRALRFQGVARRLHGALTTAETEHEAAVPVQIRSRRDTEEELRTLGYLE